MKKLTIILALFLSVTYAQAQNKGTPDKGLARAMQLFKGKNYKEAATQFHKVIFSTKSSNENKSLARYYLGVSLMRLKFHQSAAFPLISSTRELSPAVAQKAFQNLVTISDNLNDTVLLDYTLKKLDANNLSELAKEIYLNRLAQTQMKNGQYDQAIANLRQSLQISPDNDETLYTMGLVYLKQNKVQEAMQPLEKLYDKYYSRPVTDIQRGRTSIALARAYYQGKKFKEAADLYRQIPKDHPLYRESQVELTWSLFRMAKFRSAMSAVQTLHSPYYENFYDPESLILRSIILLVICQNDEADKALNTFQKNYTSAYSVIVDSLQTNTDPTFYYKQIDETQNHLKSIKVGKKSAYNGQIPFFIVRALMDTGSLKNKLSYLRKIQDERLRVRKAFTSQEHKALRNYMLTILNQREKSVQKEAGQLLIAALSAKEQELSLLTGDLSLLKYEVLNGKKQEARSEYIKKLNESPELNQVNAADNRSFYINNGYRYWPFEGEYWRDEIGNYQYLGVNRCEAQ